MKIETNELTLQQLADALSIVETCKVTALWNTNKDATGQGHYEMLEYADETKEGEHAIIMHIEAIQEWCNTNHRSIIGIEAEDNTLRIVMERKNG